MKLTIQKLPPLHFNIRYGFAIDLISGLFILLFFYTAISKLSNLEGFISVISRSPLIGMTFAPFVAWAVPIVEITICLFLFFSKSKTIGLYAATALMILFTAYTAYIIAFAEKLPCSCGGVINKLSWKEHLVFNSVFVLLGVLGLWLSKKNQK